jgi:hypothetical protein
MADPILMTDQFVSAGDLDDKNIKCPQCGSDTYVLIGNFQISRMEDWQSGQLLNTTLGEEHVFELEIIECLSCKTRSRVKPQEMMNLEKVNQTLRAKIIDLTGEDPYGHGKPN